MDHSINVIRSVMFDDTQGLFEYGSLHRDTVSQECGKMVVVTKGVRVWRNLNLQALKKWRNLKSVVGIFFSVLTMELLFID